jgi:hypothetical protein
VDLVSGKPNTVLRDTFVVNSCRFADSPGSFAPFVPNIDLKNDLFLCNARSWLEVSFLDKFDVVVDGSCNVPANTTEQPSPEIGQRNRQAFAQAHIENPTGNLEDFGVIDGGQCCECTST